MTINLEVNVSGRFKILDQPYVSPSKCAFCSLGHNQDGTVMFIDTTLELDFFGVVYICSNCLLEISTSLGYISPEGWVALKEHREKVLDENARLKGENEGLRSAVNLLTGHRCFDAAISQPSISEAETEAKYDESLNRSLEGVEPSQSESDSSSGEQGLSDVRGIAKSSESDDKPIRKRTKPVDLEL